jgi:hypothetical protein
MCGGGLKRAQRQAEEHARQFEQSLQAAEKRNQEVVTALKPKFTPAPMETGAALEDNGGVRKKRSKKSSIIDANKGVSSLRIGLNTGNTGSGSGPNMG